MKIKSINKLFLIKIKSQHTAVFFAILLLIIILSCNDRARVHNIKAVKGILDLSSGSSLTQTAVPLDGEWEFYWGRLLSPESFKSSTTPVPDGYFKVPLYWTSYDRNRFPAKGYATYRLTVKLPAPYENLCISTPEIFTEYKLWINGLMINQRGSFDGGYVKFMKPDIFTFFSHSGTIEIVLQIKNFRHGNSGIGQSLFLGSPEIINSKHLKDSILEFILVAICLFASFYHIILYTFRKAEKELLYFGLFCLAIALRTFLTGTTFISEIFPDLPFETGSRIATAIIPLSVSAFILFLYNFFKNILSKKIVSFLLSMHLIYIIIILFTPTFFYSSAFTPYLLVIVLNSVFVVTVIIYAILKKEQYSLIFLGGFSFILIGILNDTFHYMQIINTGYYLSLWFSFFIIAYSVMLAIKFSKEHLVVEELSEKLQIADRLKDEFLANTSHELRTPINGIIGISEFLIDGISGPLSERTIENLNLIVSSGKRLSSLINDILDFSRLRNNDIILQHRKIDLRQLTSIVMTVIHTTMPEKNINLINDIPPDLPFAEGDENRLQQVMYNLIGNAIKFTVEGFVRVTAIEKDESLEICVEDSGIGINRKKLGDIFKSFEQADGSVSREYGGTGLGLPITKKLVELHGGHIHAESEEGKGSKFIFTLKRASENLTTAVFGFNKIEKKPIVQKTLKIRKRPESDEKKKRARILLVDDEKINIHVLLNYLSEKKYSIDFAFNGLEALEMIEKNIYDLILLDIMMPRMSGYDVCRKLREKFTAFELPVLIMTAKNHSSDIVTAFEVGANDYLVKPFDKNELIARIETHLSLKKAINDAIENARLANIDQLTGLYNRRYFLTAGKREFINSKFHGKPLSVIMIDIDDFKQINDKSGHDTGDEVIRQLSATIAGNIRGLDIAGRYGGEEFIIILPGTDRDGALIAAEKIRKLAERNNINVSEKDSLSYTISLGVASYNDTMTHIEDLIKKADEMLYVSKRDGKNMVSAC